MDIERLKLMYGWKELPFQFYVMGMFALIFPLSAIMGLLVRFDVVPIWIGIIVVVVWCIFVGLKAYKKYISDKLLKQGI